MLSNPFAAPSDLGPEGQDNLAMKDAPFGVRASNHRYKLPLLPGEEGPKSGGDWVPRGVQSATNLAGAIVESRQLGIWERERTQIGLALRPDLVERLTYLINKGLRADGIDFANERLHDSPAGKAIVEELKLIHKEAKQTAGGNLAAQRGTNRHDVWEARAATGQLFGTPEVNEQIEKLEELLERKGLERVPGLQERVVRNTTLNAAGRFDDVLRATRDIVFPVPTSAGNGFHVIFAGTLLMADLKTKQRAYYSWLEVRIQLAVYATAEWMLHTFDPAPGSTLQPEHRYVPGPQHHVNQQWGVVLWAPSNGAEPQLKRCNIRTGFEHAKLARLVCDARSEGRGVAAHAEAEWPDA